MPWLSLKFALKVMVEMTSAWLSLKFSLKFMGGMTHRNDREMTYRNDMFLLKFFLKVCGINVMYMVCRIILCTY